MSIKLKYTKIDLRKPFKVHIVNGKVFDGHCKKY
jgi:hypothetical protein